MSWVKKAYSHLRMGRRLLHSSCDFLAQPQETPNYWRLALKAHGTLRGLVPYDGTPDAQNQRTPETIHRYAEPKGACTVRVGGHWPLGRVLMEQLFYNPHLSGRWGAATLDPETYALEQRQLNGPGASEPKISAVEARNKTQMPKKFTTAQTLRRTRPHSHRPLA